MTPMEFTNFRSSWAAVYGHPMHPEAVDAWQRQLIQANFEVANAALLLHSEQRDNGRAVMGLAEFKRYYAIAAKRLRFAEDKRLVGCDRCEGTGYLHYLCGGEHDSKADPATNLFKAYTEILDLGNTKPGQWWYLRLCGVPCPGCDLGRDNLQLFQRERETRGLGHLLESDAELAALQQRAMPLSEARQWLDFLGGHQQQSPIIRRRAPCELRALVSETQSLSPAQADLSGGGADLEDSFA